MVGMLAIRGSEMFDVGTGTGTGAVPSEVEGVPVPHRRKLGVDVSKPMLARARAALAPDTELVAADARALPLSDASVDVATCADLLHLLPADAHVGVLREARRVLVADAQAPGSARRAWAVGFEIEATRRVLAGYPLALRPR